MSQEDVHREPRVAYCEDDYDSDEIATPLANVAVKRAHAASITKRASYERRRNDGSDSGYSSKTGTNTNTSTSSSRKDMAELKIDTSTMERQPQPYAFIQRPEAHRRSSSRSRQDIFERPAQKTRYYVHKKGDCYVCDTWGEHLPEDIRPREAAVPPSPKANKEVQERTSRRDDPAPHPRRRDSSVRASRPVTMYAPGGLPFGYQPTQPPNVLQYPPMSPAGWATPLTPTMPYSAAFAYTPTAMTATYGGEYFEKVHSREERPSRPDRRSSIYGDAIIRQSKVDTRPAEPQRTSSTRDHTRSNSDRTIHAEDSDRMPPPPRPSVTLAHRPSIKKSATYNTPVTSNANRRSQVIDNDAVYVSNSTAQSPSRERRVEPSLPPSSYRGPTEVFESRPRNRKSQSYSTPTDTTKISSSTLPPGSTSHPRRSTTTATPTETRKVAEAENYQAQRRSLTSSDLTAEALRNLKERNPSSRSETSSHRSHHTKSSSSAGGKSKRSNSEIKMIINGVNVSIPTSSAEQNISISTRKDGDISISLGSRASRDDDGSRASSQKRLDRAPSTTSRASRVSSKSIGLKEREHERERERERELEQYERVRRKSGPSRSQSRAEVVRRSYDHDRNSPNPWKE